MATLYLPDTNILIAAMKGYPGLQQHLGSLPRGSMRLSAIVLGELELGAEKKRLREA